MGNERTINKKYKLVIAANDNGRVKVFTSYYTHHDDALRQMDYLSQRLFGKFTLHEENERGKYVEIAGRFI